MGLQVVSESRGHARNGREFLAITFRDSSSGRQVKNYYFFEGSSTFANIYSRIQPLDFFYPFLMQTIANGKIIDYKGLTITVFENQDIEIAFQEQKWKLDRRKDEYDDSDWDYQSTKISKYGGAYGFDDDTIDSAFEGDPENYWNID